MSLGITSSLSLPFPGAPSRPELMGVIMADQATGVRRTVVGDRSPTVGRDHVGIKIHQAFARNVARWCAHPVGRMAYRARESILLNVAGVFAEAAVIQNLREIVALGAQSIRAAAGAAHRADIRVREQIRNESSRKRRLTELIPALQDVRKD